jgi:protein-disulfide isomerase
MFHDGGGPLSLILDIISGAFSALAAAVAVAVIAGVLFLLVRFLWFGTRAAQLYLKKNGDSGRFTWPVTPVGGAPAAAPPAPATPSTATTSDAPTEVFPASGLPATGEPAAPRSPLKPRSAPPAE